LNAPGGSRADQDQAQHPRPRIAPGAIAELCKVGKADLVQVIGKMALIYRKNFSVNKQLSNVHRFK
jgi:RNA-binding protein YhbY